jgi:NaMN:DMB phosphoribosyltransferase
MSAEILAIAALVVRAEEAWEPVLLGGMIPVIGALAVLYIIIRAVRDNPENDEKPDKDQ